MTPQFNAAQMILLAIGGTAAGQAFGHNKDNAPGIKRGFTKTSKAKRK